MVGRFSTKRNGGRNQPQSINMTEVKLKQSFMHRNTNRFGSMQQNNDIAKRKPFDIDAIGDNEEVVSFENKKLASANRTGNKFFQNGMNVLGPKVGPRFNTNRDDVGLISMEIDMPNGVGKHGKQLKSPS